MCKVTKFTRLMNALSVLKRKYYGAILVARINSKGMRIPATFEIVGDCGRALKTLLP